MIKTITSRKNDKVVHMKKLGSSRSYRRENGEFLCDGIKLLGEALQFGVEITAIFTSEELQFSIDDSIDVYMVPQSIIETISPMKNPQTVLFSCKMRENKNAESDKRIMILENVQDPGNVGTVLRTANAFGIDKVILVGACADPYNPKTIRATMGAIFRQTIEETDIDGIKALRERGMKVYGAALSSESVDIGTISWDNTAIVIGSEGQGLTQEMMDACDGCVIIPMEPNSESLNAAIAASVFMWEMRKNKK